MIRWSLVRDTAWMLFRREPNLAGGSMMLLVLLAGVFVTSWRGHGGPPVVLVWPVVIAGLCAWLYRWAGRLTRRDFTPWRPLPSLPATGAERALALITVGLAPQLGGVLLLLALSTRFPEVRTTLPAGLLAIALASVVLFPLLARMDPVGLRRSSAMLGVAVVLHGVVPLPWGGPVVGLALVVIAAGAHRPPQHMRSARPTGGPVGAQPVSLRSAFWRLRTGRADDRLPLGTAIASAVMAVLSLLLAWATQEDHPADLMVVSLLPMFFMVGGWRAMVSSPRGLPPRPGWPGQPPRIPDPTTGPSVKIRTL